MPATESWTIGRLLTWTTDYLKQRGADNPRLDAEVLLAEARGCQRIELYTAFDQEAQEPVRMAFRELVRRRAEGTPVAYLVGRREFYSLNFRVTPDVLIPRPETELLVVTLLDTIKTLPASVTSISAVDVGTGSGNVAITCAKHCPRLQMTAVDLSPEALKVAELNAEDHKLQNRITFLHSDLLDAVPASQRFDFIVSNPPYVTSDEMTQLPRDVGEHEPHMALDGGTEGTDVIARLISQAATRLNPGGFLFMEISPMIQDSVLQLLHDAACWDVLETVKDFARLPRIIQARLT